MLKSKLDYPISAANCLPELVTPPISVTLSWVCWPNLHNLQNSPHRLLIAIVFNFANCPKTSNKTLIQIYPATKKIIYFSLNHYIKLNHIKNTFLSTDWRFLRPVLFRYKKTKLEETRGPQKSGQSQRTFSDFSVVAFQSRDQKKVFI